jgi:hypothetical protein
MPDIDENTLLVQIKKQIQISSITLLNCSLSDEQITNLSNQIVDGKKATKLNLTNFISTFLSYFFEQPIHNTFYHYTTTNAALSIIKDKKIWATALPGLNDRNEINYFKTLYRSLYSNNSQLSEIKEIKQAYYNYAISMSEIEDSLTQWRLYGNDGRGVCLAFQFTKPNINGYNQKFGKVNYGSNSVNQIHELCIKIAEICGYKQYQLNPAYWEYFFKDDAYADEKEVRLIIDARLADYDTEKQWQINRNGELVHVFNYDISLNHGLKLIGLKIGPKVKEYHVQEIAWKKLIAEKRLNIEVSTSRHSHYK